MKYKIYEKLDIIGIACRALLVIGILSIQACSITSYVSDNYVDMSKQISFKGKEPIARELKFVYADGNIISGVGGKTHFLLATNLSSTQEVNKRGAHYIKDKYPGVKDEHFENTAELNRVIYLQEPDFSAKARAASEKMDSGEPLTLTESGAYQTREMAKSFDNSIALMNTSLATVSALKSLVKAMHEKHGYQLKNWIEENTGAIGSSAPKGSILNIDFIRVLKGESFNYSSDTEFIVSAYLVRKNRKTIYSTRGIVMKVFSDKPEPTQTKNMILYKNAASHITDKPKIQQMKSMMFGVEFAALANAAINDIYQQLDKGVRP